MGFGHDRGTNGIAPKPLLTQRDANASRSPDIKAQNAPGACWLAFLLVCHLVYLGQCFVFCLKFYPVYNFVSALQIACRAAAANNHHFRVKQNIGDDSFFFAIGANILEPLDVHARQCKFF
jgi:hypothetical protein